MAGNTTPIFSRVGDIQGGALLQTGVSDYTGTNVAIIPIFNADVTNGGFVQRLRFKAGAGNNAVTVARVWINDGVLNQTSPLSVPQWGAVTPSTTGGSLNTGTFYAKIQAVDQWGGTGIASTETAAISLTGAPGNTGSITYNWTGTSGASYYRVWVGPAAGGEYAYFTTTTNAFVQTVPYITGQIANPADYGSNNMFYGEVSLPATTAIATAATVEVDYPMNIAIPPGFRVLVGLGTTVSGGWIVTAIGGKY